MGLLDSIKETEEELAKIEGKEALEPEIVESEKPEEPAKEAPKEPEEPAEPKEPIEEPKLSTEEAARAAYYRRREEAEKRNAAAPKVEVAPASNAPTTPSPDDDLEGHVLSELEELKKWRNEVKQKEEHQEIINGALQEFSNFEQNFKATASDYEDVSDHVLQRISSGIEALHPYATKKEVENETNRQILIMASNFRAQGLNPAEELYKLGKERYGFVAKEVAQTAATTERASAKPDLSKLDAQRRRSHSPLGTNGQGGAANTTLEKLKRGTLSNAEMSRLTPQDLEELEKAVRLG